MRLQKEMSTYIRRRHPAATASIPASVTSGQCARERRRRFERAFESPRSPSSDMCEQKDRSSRSSRTHAARSSRAKSVIDGHPRKLSVRRLGHDFPICQMTLSSTTVQSPKSRCSSEGDRSRSFIMTIGSTLLKPSCGILLLARGLGVMTPGKRTDDRCCDTSFQLRRQVLAIRNQKGLSGRNRRHRITRLSLSGPPEHKES
mmetsp:Transcript_35567/g.84213  ORF Transcript_35567/g.84213 Transcript_35567/m.84213 type:complete len:202 (-) Transcript_35567:349-954(-)